MAVLRLDDINEECVLAILPGPVEATAQAPVIGPNDCLLFVSFKKRGPGFWRTESDGKRYWIQPLLEDEPTANESRWAAHHSATGALAHLERERAQLLAAGWLEGSFDPVNDPD